jgi:hypothetical protein
LPSITISTVWSESKLAVQCMRSPSIPLPLIVWISLPLPMLGKAPLMSIRSTPAMCLSHQAACALLTVIAATSTADRQFLLPNWPSLSCPLLSASSAISSATTFSTTCPMQLAKEMQRYALSVVLSSFPGIPITTPLACFQTAGCRPVPITDHASSTIRIFSHSQSRCQPPKVNLSEPVAFPTACTNRARSTACWVTDWCFCPTGASSKYWPCSFGGKDSRLTIFSFLVIVSACYSSLSGRACTVTPAHGLANFAAL